MKILVLSDSHGCMEYMRRAVQKEQPDLICHLGDCAMDAVQLSQEYFQIPFLSVPGNCDFPDSQTPLVRITQEAGVKIFLTHGHRYGVKSSLLRLELAAKEAGCQVAIFGHTHVPYCQKAGGLWLLNPGACQTRLRYGVIIIEKGTPLCYNVANETPEEDVYAAHN